MDLRFAYLPDTAPRGIRSPSKTTAGTCFAGSFSGQTRMTSMMLLVMPQRMSRIAGCPSEPNINTIQHLCTAIRKVIPLASEKPKTPTTVSPYVRQELRLTHTRKKSALPVPATEGILPYLEWV